MNISCLHRTRTSVIFLALFATSMFLNASPASEIVPKIMYWAWEAPQDLSTIDPINSGIAELAASIYIKGTDPYYYLRHQPLRAPHHIYRIAVIHIEARAQWHPVFNSKLVKSIAEKIQIIYQKKPYSGLQIDFEVLHGQRSFYYNLLREIRQLMGKNLFISITGLASWCTSDGWIGKEKLPVDLVVPMYFSISNELRQRQAFISRFPNSIKRLAPECQSAIGLATFEEWQIPLRAQVPVFVFTKGSWTQKNLNQAKKLADDIHH